MSKADGNYIEHGFGILPGILTKDRLDQLVSLLKDGTATDEELEELTKGHLRLALYTASKYSRSARHLGDELLAEAAFGLAIALTKAPEKLRDLEITPYIVTWMRKFVLKKLGEDSAVTIPYTSLKRHDRRKITTSGRVEDLIDHETGVAELRELIYKAVKKDFEREVIKLRELGLKDNEIADRLSCSREKVGKAKLRVLRRFQETEV